jgi:hypothetical protein
MVEPVPLVDPAPEVLPVEPAPVASDPLPPEPALPLGGGTAPELVLPAGSEDVLLLELLFFSFLVVVEVSPDPP